MSNLEFIEESHQYLLDGVLIPSVSEIINFTLDEYSNVPKKTLEKAANFGTRVHQICESYLLKTEVEDYWDEDYDIYKSFKNCCINKGLDDYQVECEIPVYTDEYAGTIDIIASKKRKVGIYDIKSNRVYPEEHLKLQLNLYKKAYEYLHKKKVSELGCFWLNRKTNEFEYHGVEFLTDEELNQLIINFKTKNKPVVQRNELQEIQILPIEKLQKLEQFYELKDEVVEIEKMINEIALEKMEEYGVKSFKSKKLVFNYKPPYERTSIDTQKLKDDGLYETYSKKVKVKESISIKWNR